ncbi:uncharacterized protein [Arachis hypogaea]|uniref:uncharacterized protein n=1 Tax=Arachis hypogaea TaxID=3818 RepID=UPI003B220457
MVGKRHHGYKTLSFMDAYSGYNHILMHPSDQNKIAFITDYGNYCYKVMPFEPKNAGTTYQRLMDKVFADQIGRNLEVYVDDIVAKTKLSDNHLNNLLEIFNQVRRYNMRLNSEKCAFGVQGELTGRLVKWSVELSEFDIRYQRRGPIKSQYLVDFIAEFTVPSSVDNPTQWTLYVDGASNPQGCGTRVLLEDGNGFVLEQALHLSFKASNNQTEYKVVIAGLRLVAELKISDLQVYCDSLLVVQQRLKIKQHFSSVEHPQTNGLAEAANKVILHALRKKLDDAKGLWAELVPEVIWGYNTTIHSTTKEMPFRKVYGSEAMLPLEISQSSIRTQIDDHNEAQRIDLESIEEVRDIATLRHRVMQQIMSRRHNQKVHPRSFQVNKLVLHKTEQSRRPSSHGKLAANWEGPFRVIEVLGNGACQLQSLHGTTIPNTWNVSSLKHYYS